MLWNHITNGGCYLSVANMEHECHYSARTSPNRICKSFANQDINQVRLQCLWSARTVDAGKLYEGDEGFRWQEAPTWKRNYYCPVLKANVTKQGSEKPRPSRKSLNCFESTESGRIVEPGIVHKLIAPWRRLVCVMSSAKSTKIHLLGRPLGNFQKFEIVLKKPWDEKYVYSLKVSELFVMNCKNLNVLRNSKRITKSSSKRQAWSKLKHCLLVPSSTLSVLHAIVHYELY